MITFIQTYDTEDKLTPQKIYLYGFVHDNALDVPQALRNAVSAFLATEAGQREVASNSGCFNWGDALRSIPDENLERFGLQPYTLPRYQSLGLDHNETLL